MSIKSNGQLVPARFPRLNEATESLIGNENLSDPTQLHRALERLDAAEKAGIDVYDGVKILDS
jgi:hypothetical protein